MSDKRGIEGAGESSCPQDRRRQRRVRISAPVRIRSVEGGDESSDEFTTTVNMSPGGLLIETVNPDYYPDMKVAVTLPYSESADSAQTEQEGRVVRVTEVAGGRRAVAIALNVCNESIEIAVDESAGRTQETALPLVVV